MNSAIIAAHITARLFHSPGARNVATRLSESSLFACALVASILPQLATSAPEDPSKDTRDSPDIISGTPLNELPNFPYGYDIIGGNPPDGRIQRWTRYVVLGLRNHPIPIVFFSPQEFKPKTSLELLIVLPDSEYKSLSALTRSQPCEKLEPPQTDAQWRAGEITEHDCKRTTRCALPPIDACNYPLASSSYPISTGRQRNSS
jgi:hypothetical protein